MGMALDWLIKQYGGRLREDESTAVTGAGFASVAPNDPDACSLLFENTGPFAIFLVTQQNAPASSGILLAPNGGIVSMNLLDDFTLPTKQWFAASPGGASGLYILRLKLEIPGE
jgi:hypothetical protein